MTSESMHLNVYVLHKMHGEKKEREIDRDEYVHSEMVSAFCCTMFAT